MEERSSGQCECNCNEHCDALPAEEDADEVEEQSSGQCEGSCNAGDDVSSEEPADVDDDDGEQHQEQDGECKGDGKTQRNNP